MKNRTKTRILDIILNALSFLTPVIGIILIGGFILQMIRSFQMQGTSFFVDYAQISLTLFGFTLIGAIFEQKRAQKIVKQLFGLSIVFISSAISFFVLHSIAQFSDVTGITQTLFQIVTFVALLIAFLGLAYGLLSLLLLLLRHYKEGI